MEEKDYFEKINGLLEETDYPLEIKDIGDLEDFLNDEDNRRLEQYEVIGRLYDDIMGEADIDRFPEGEM